MSDPRDYLEDASEAAEEAREWAEVPVGEAVETVAEEIFGFDF